jgi:imidazolonepropionase-like amidohydrolase
MNRVIIEGRMLIDGTGRPPVERGAVLVEGDRIIAVGTKESIEPVSGVNKIDAKNLVLLPGLIDCHNHPSAGMTKDGQPEGLSGSDAELTINALINMALDLSAGVTTVRCLGDRNFLDIACKKAVESGRIAGPRLIVAGRSIRSFHGHGILASPFDGAEAIRRGIRENIKAGADVIKILTSATVKGKDTIRSDCSREEICAAVDEAHRAGLPVTAHCIGGIGLQWCLEAGMESIEHGYFVSDHDIELLLHHNTWLVLTPGPFLSEERITASIAGMGETVLRNREEAARCMAGAIRGGVRFVVGSDAIHGRLAKEMECLVGLGASEEQVILAATRDAAKVCGVPDTVGTIEPGKSADIIGVEGNPLRDISALERVGFVMARGKIRSLAGTGRQAKHQTPLGSELKTR